MQQTLTGCAFCSVTPRPVPRVARRIPGAKTSGSLTPSVSTVRSRRNWIPTNAITTPATAVGSSSTPLAALTRFRVELGHLEGPLQLCERCSPGGLATYWTRDLEEHLVADC